MSKSLELTLETVDLTFDRLAFFKSKNSPVYETHKLKIIRRLLTGLTDISKLDDENKNIIRNQIIVHDRYGKGRVVDFIPNNQGYIKIKFDNPTHTKDLPNRGFNTALFCSNDLVSAKYIRFSVHDQLKRLESELVAINSAVTDCNIRADSKLMTKNKYTTESIQSRERMLHYISKALENVNMLNF